MIRKALPALLLALAAMIVPTSQTHAWPVVPGVYGPTAVPPPPSCPFTYLPADDGCAGAPAGTGATSGTLYQDAAFFAHSMQSGQTQYFSAPGTPSAHPPPWNIAGQDYPVAFSLADVPGGALKDPSVAALPTGCSYALGTVTCSSVTGIIFNGYDFTNVLVDLNTSVHGTVEFVHCYFKNGAHTATDFGNIILEGPATANLLAHYNFVDGNAQNFPSQPVDFIRNLSGSGTVTLQYNYFASLIGLGVTTGSGNYLVQYNVINGINFDALAHGEFDIFNGIATSGGTLPALKESFNTILQPATFGGGATAPFFESSGATDGSIFTNVMVDHNTSIINYFAFTMSQLGTAGTIPTSGALSCKSLDQAPFGTHLIVPGHSNETVTAGACTGEGAGGSSPYHGSLTLSGSQTFTAQTVYAIVTSVALSEIGRNTYGTVTFDTNYVYCTATFFCMADTGSTVGSTVWNGNVNMGTGNPIVAYNTTP